jgi:DNA-binding NtrC family response regulator
MSQSTPADSAAAILFVDDEAKSRKYFSLLFGRKRRVITAEDGVEGLELFRRHREDIALVVTDHLMPRMTGLEFLEHLEAENARVTRILSTAYTENELVEAAVNRGLIDYFIGKPWDMEKLESIVEQSFSLQERRRPA